MDDKEKEQLQAPINVWGIANIGCTIENPTYQTLVVPSEEQKTQEAEQMEKEFADFEEVVAETAESPAKEEVCKRGFASAAVHLEKVDAIVGLICRLMEGKTKPKDVMMPVRAAMEAGVIRRPTWEEFCSEFGKDRIKSKASFSDYTNPENKPYDGADFETMKEAFQAL